MISRSSITENQIENVGIEPCVNVTGDSFSRKAVNPLYCPVIFDAPSVLLEMHLETSMFASAKPRYPCAKLLSTNCTGLLQLPNICQQWEEVVLRHFP